MTGGVPLQEDKEKASYTVMGIRASREVSSLNTTANFVRGGVIVFLCNVGKWQDTCLLVEIQKKHEQLTKKEEGLAKLSSFFAVHLQKGISLVDSHVLQTSPWLKMKWQVKCVIFPCWYVEQKFSFCSVTWSVCVWISQGFYQPHLIAFQLFWLLYLQTKVIIT